MRNYLFIICAFLSCIQYVRAEVEPVHLIISRSEFQKAAQDLTAYRDKYENVKSQFVSIETIKKHESDAVSSPDFPGWSNKKPTKINIKNYDFLGAKKIAGYLKDYAEKQPIGSVTLIGDGAIVPPSYYFYDKYESDPNYGDYTAWIPSDIFYGSPDLDLKYDWPVGRISVDTVDQALTYSGKLKHWRQDMDPKNLPPSIYFGGNVTRNFLYFGELFYDIIQADSLMGKDPTVYLESGHEFGTGLGLHTIRKVPASLMWIFSHGLGEGFVFQDFPVLAEHIEKAPYKAGLPLILSPSCMDGGYDYDLIDVPYDIDGLSVGEAIIRADGAGIGYLGGSRVNLTNASINFDSGMAKLSDAGFMPAILVEFLKHNKAGKKRVGEAFKAAYHDYLTQNTVKQPGDLATYASFIYMGDPTIMLPQLEQETTTSEFKGVQFAGDFTLNTDNIPVFPSGTNPIQITRPESVNAELTVRVIDAIAKSTIVLDYPLTDQTIHFSPPKDSLYFVYSENQDGIVRWQYFWVGASKTIAQLAGGQ